VTVNFVTLTDTGSAHWVAANGDSIDATIVGSGAPVMTPDGLVFSITDVFTGPSGISVGDSVEDLPRSRPGVQGKLASLGACGAPGPRAVLVA
jgi:hypothetical protein